MNHGMVLSLTNLQKHPAFGLSQMASVHEASTGTYCYCLAEAGGEQTLQAFRHEDSM